MPMTTTHALVPLAGALAFSNGRSPPWRLIAAAAMAAAIPDMDDLSAYLWGLPTTSVYAHRGAAHSLFAALVVGLIAALFHRALRARPLTAGVVVAAAMASHGLLDMMTDSGRPVAYLWPVSSLRFFADWRPIHSAPVAFKHLASQAGPRLRSEFLQLILPMFGVASVIRIARSVLGQR